MRGTNHRTIYQNFKSYIEELGCVKKKRKKNREYGMNQILRFQCV